MSLTRNRSTPWTAIVVAALLAAALIAGGIASSARGAKAKEYGHVTAGISLPTTNNEAVSYARDLDKDGEKDNRFGRIFATLASQGLDLQVPLNIANDEGDLLMLHSLRTPSLRKTKDASWQVFYGIPTESPDFSGAGSFTVDVSAPHSGKLAASIKRHKLKTAAGTIPLRLDFGGDDFDLSLKSGKVFATCGQTSCPSGRINGAISAEEVDLVFAPELASTASLFIARDCPGSTRGSCASGSEGLTYANAFDANEDMSVSAEEVRTQPLISSLFTPDIDLEKANGSPGRDGEPDSLSFGFGFQAARADLVRP